MGFSLKWALQKTLKNWCVCVCICLKKVLIIKSYLGSAPLINNHHHQDEMTCLGVGISIKSFICGEPASWGFGEVEIQIMIWSQFIPYKIHVLQPFQPMTRWFQISFMFIFFIPIPGEMIQFDCSNSFQMGWFNHQLLLMEEIPNNHLGCTKQR